MIRVVTLNNSTLEATPELAVEFLTRLAEAGICLIEGNNSVVRLVGQPTPDQRRRIEDQLPPNMRLA